MSRNDRNGQNIFFFKIRQAKGQEMDELSHGLLDKYAYGHHLKTEVGVPLKEVSEFGLTHWGLNKDDQHLQRIFSNAICEKKNKNRWSLFLSVHPIDHRSALAQVMTWRQKAVENLPHGKQEPAYLIPNAVAINDMITEGARPSAAMVLT